MRIVRWKRVSRCLLPGNSGKGREERAVRAETKAPLGLWRGFSGLCEDTPDRSRRFTDWPGRFGDLADSAAEANPSG